MNVKECRCLLTCKHVCLGNDGVVNSWILMWYFNKIMNDNIRYKLWCRCYLSSAKYNKDGWRACLFLNQMPYGKHFWNRGRFWDICWRMCQQTFQGIVDRYVDTNTGALCLLTIWLRQVSVYLYWNSINDNMHNPTYACKSLKLYIS